VGRETHTGYSETYLAVATQESTESMNFLMSNELYMACHTFLEVTPGWFLQFAIYYAFRNNILFEFNDSKENGQT
jgi:hypothetical protein